MIKKEKVFVRKTAPENSARMVETIYGCKWSLTVFGEKFLGILEQLEALQDEIDHQYSEQ